ncbi:Rad17 cell cycle checkpoint protein-domain-containing protein [Dipodascopsis tothii]|uniref:Rad17 cell cycle checkpoint protein-domain-containing protein n=1 Tax=Dipodascopsis tothii TaxID=44089 RepID=UPI0034CF8654
MVARKRRRLTPQPADEVKSESVGGTSKTATSETATLKAASMTQISRPSSFRRSKCRSQKAMVGADISDTALPGNLLPTGALSQHGFVQRLEPSDLADEISSDSDNTNSRGLASHKVPLPVCQRRPRNFKSDVRISTETTESLSAPTDVDFSTNDQRKTIEAFCKPGNRPWVEKYAPRHRSQLAIHKRKYEEVMHWTQAALSVNTTSKLLVLTGPAGSSKTATLRMICHELDIDLVEWFDPMATRTESDSPDYVSVLNKFCEFLEQARLFPSSVESITADAFATIAKTRPRIVVVEDIPAAFTTSTTIRRRFQDALLSYALSKKLSVVPLVVIVSDVGSIEADDDIGGIYRVETILGRRLLTATTVRRISFNPINKTLMSRVLGQVVSREKLAGANLKRVVSELAKLGDVRSAINALQWWAKNPEEEPDVNLWLPVGRENYLALFHAVGKIIYNKRENSDHFFEDDERPTSLVDLDEILSSVSAPKLVSTIFENYALSCPSAESLEACSGGFSDSDVLLETAPAYSRLLETGCVLTRRVAHHWDSGKKTFNKIGAEICARNLLVKLPIPVKRSCIPGTGGSHDKKSSPIGVLNGSLEYRVYQRQLDTASKVHNQLTERHDSRVFWSPSKFMTERAFYEALINRDDHTRQIGGTYTCSARQLYSMYKNDDTAYEDPPLLSYGSCVRRSEETFLSDERETLLLSEDDIEED